MSSISQGLWRINPARWSGAVTCAVALLLTSSPAFASANTSGEGETQIARCIHRAAAKRPWLEKTLWGLRDQEAGWIGAEVRNTNGSHDLGPLQINSGWVPTVASLLDRSEANVRYWLRYDPCFNVDAARWIFLSALQTTGDFWRAVGVYHSPTAWRQRRYAWSVARHMQDRFGGEVFAAGGPAVSAAQVGAGESDAVHPTISSVKRPSFGVQQGRSN